MDRDQIADVMLRITEELVGPIVDDADDDIRPMLSQIYRMAQDIIVAVEMSQPADTGKLPSVGGNGYMPKDLSQSAMKQVPGRGK